MKPTLSGTPRESRTSRVTSIVFLILTLLIGLGITTFFYGGALVKVVKARAWDATTCTVISNRMVVSYAADEPTYGQDLRYSYAVGGTNYIGYRYEFLHGLTGDQGRIERLVAQLQPGTSVTCWVNPGDPTDVVIERGVTAVFWSALVPLLFVVIGIVGLVGARSDIGVRLGFSTAAVSTVPTLRVPTGPDRWLESETSVERRRKRWKLTVGLALFWNFMTFLLFGPFVAALQGWVFGIALVIYLPFVAIALGLMYRVVKDRID